MANPFSYWIDRSRRKGAARVRRRKCEPCSSIGRLESLENRAMMWVASTYSGTVLNIDITGSDNSVALDFQTFATLDANKQVISFIGAFLTTSSNPDQQTFSDVSQINVVVSDPDTAANNRVSFNLLPGGLGFNNSSFVFEGAGTTGSGLFSCETKSASATFLDTVGLNLTDVDSISFSQANEIRLDGVFSNNTADATVIVSPGTGSTGAAGGTAVDTKAVLGTNRPLQADDIQIETGRPISILNSISAGSSITLRSDAPLDLPYDIKAGSRLVLDGAGGVLQRMSSTITAPVLEVVNRVNGTGTGGDIDLSSPANDFNSLRIQSFTTGKVGVVDADDLRIDGYGILAPTGQVVLNVAGALIFDAPIQASGLIASSGQSILSTANGALTLGDLGLTLDAAKSTEDATGDITLYGSVTIGTATLSNRVFNRLRSRGTITIGKNFVSSHAGSTQIEGDAGILISAPIQVGVTDLNATSTTAIPYDADLTLVSAAGGITILDAPGNDAIPCTIQVTNILSLDASGDITIGGRLFAGTIYGNPSSLSASEALPAITVQGDSKITITPTGSLTTKTYENDPNTQTNPLIGRISIEGATQLLHQGSISADGAAMISIVGDALLLGSIATRADISVQTSTGSIDVEGTLRAAGGTYANASTQTANVLLSAPSGSIATSGAGSIAAGTIASSTTSYGTVTLVGQQDVTLAAAIDTPGGVSVSTKLGAFVLNALLRTQNGQSAVISSANGISESEFGKIDTSLLDLTVTNTGSAFDITLLQPSNSIRGLAARNYSPGGSVKVATNSGTSVSDVSAIGGVSISATGTLTLTGTAQSDTADVTLQSTSGDLSLGGANAYIHALAGVIVLVADCGSATIQRICAEDDVSITAPQGITVVTRVESEAGKATLSAASGPVTIADVLAQLNIAIDAAKDVQVSGLVQSLTGDLVATTTSGSLAVSSGGKMNAVAGSVSLTATRGSAGLLNIFANRDISVTSLGDVALNGILNTTLGDIAVRSTGDINNAARLTAGGSINLDAKMSVGSLGGGIVDLQLLSGGTNYDYAIITIAPPSSGGGRAALARAEITGGVITKLVLLDPGYGYSPGERVKVTIEGNTVQTASAGGSTGGRPAAAGATAVATAGTAVSTILAGDSVVIAAGTAISVANEVLAKAGSVTMNVTAGPLKVADIFAGTDIGLEAAKTIQIAGLVMANAGLITVTSTGGGIDMSGTVRSPGGGVNISAAGQIVQRGGSVSRDKIYLLSGGRDYTYALVVVAPPPGAGNSALARAVITYYNPFDVTEGGYISDIVLLDGGWGYPSDSRVNVSIQGDGEGATAVFATDLVTSSVEAKDDVSLVAGDSITLVSTVRSSLGSVDISNTLGDIAVQSITAGDTAAVVSSRGKATLVSVVANDDVTVSAHRGVTITDGVNSNVGDISITTTNGDLTFIQQLNFGDNYLVDTTATALTPQAVIATKGGSISLASDNGAIVTPYVINAAKNVSLKSFGALELTNEITSVAGDIQATSTSGRVSLASNVAALAGSVNISSHTSLVQEVVSGISKIELLSPGPVLDQPPDVTVTIAPPKGGGEPAIAFAVIERRASTNFNTSANNNQNVVPYEYFIGSIAIINPGRGYAVGEQPVVTITGVAGATARAYGPTAVQMVTAQKNISLLAGENMTLVTKIHSVAGAVNVRSSTGDLDLSSDSLLVSAKAGGISIGTDRGSAKIQRAAGFGNVAIDALQGVSILGSVYSETGTIGLTALNGAIDARQLNAQGNVSLTAFRSSTLGGEIASKTGDITSTITAGGTFLNANLVAGRDISLSSQTFLQQGLGTGLDNIQIVSAGSEIGTSNTNQVPKVTITIAPPAAGGVTATAEAVIGKRSLGRNAQSNVETVEFYIDSILITNAGQGYALGENPAVTVAGLNGAVLRAIGPTNLKNLTATRNVTIDSGAFTALVNTTNATTGDIAIESLAGDLDLGGQNMFLSAPRGKVSLLALGGAATVQRIRSGNTIDVQAQDTFKLLGRLNSSAGDVSLLSTTGDLDFSSPSSQIYAAKGGVTLTSSNGQVITPPILNVLNDVKITGYDNITLSNNLTSQTGKVAVTSTAASITLASNVISQTQSVALTAKGSIVQQGSTGLSGINVTRGGSGYAAGVTVTIAPPRNGGTAAQAVAVIGTVGGVSGVITGITITNPGSGYAFGESPVVTIAAPANGTGSGATARAVGPNGIQNISANTDVTLSAGTGVSLVNAINANTGNVAIGTVNGDVVFSGQNALIGVQKGNVVLSSINGTVVSPPVLNISGDITMRAFGPLTVANQLTTTGGNVDLGVTGSSLNLDSQILSANEVKLSSTTGINQTRGFIKATTLTAKNATASPITLGSSTNDVDMFAATNIGAVTYVDADEFRVGTRTSGTMGVEVTGSVVSLSSVAENSVIRVVAGINYRRLFIAAGTQGGTAAGKVEFVTTNSGDNPGLSFRGTLRDMIQLANDNRSTYSADASTLWQPMKMVFDEPGYAVSEITVANTLPAFTKPVFFDGSRVNASVTTGRLGIRGSSVATSGLYFAGGSSGSTVNHTAVYGFTRGSALLIESSRNTIQDTYVGIKADGRMSSTNLVGINISGPGATLNTIGSLVFDTRQPTDGGTANRFAANTDAAILIQRKAARNQVFGNLIGSKAIADALDDSSLASSLTTNCDGVRIDDSIGNIIGSSDELTPDLTPTTSNFISGNKGAGVFIKNSQGNGTAATANVIQNNVIDANQSYGVNVTASSGVDIGGTGLMDANVIIRNTGSGIYLFNANDVDIDGNFIGVDKSVTTRLGNKRSGIEIAAASNGVAIDGNRISANDRSGIAITSRAQNVTITDNIIGGVLNTIDGFEVVDGGRGYLTAPTVTISPPIADCDGRAAQAVAMMSNGSVIGLLLADPGQGYSVDETISITFDGPSIAPAVAKVVWASAGNGGDGVLISNANGNLIGAGNRISSNAGSGVSVVAANAESLAKGNKVLGSEIFENAGHGVQIGGSNYVTVGGTTDAVTNLIYGNTLDGVRIEGHARSRFSPTGNAILGNRIGTNEFQDVDASLGNRHGIVVSRGISNVVAGNSVMNNRENGIEVRGGALNTIGGNTTETGNYIAFNKGDGIRVADQLTASVSGLPVGVPTNTTRHSISGNEITQNDGDGIKVTGSKTSAITIGQNLTVAPIAGIANEIHGNTGGGVVIDGAQRVGVQGNSIYENVAGGLTTKNQANGFAAFQPLFDGATVKVVPRTNAQVQITGTMYGEAYQRYAIDVYGNDSWDGSYNDTTGAPVGFQMRTFLGRTIVTADANGLVNFNFTIDGKLAIGDVLTLTATSLLYGPGTTSPLSDGTLVTLLNQTTPVKPKPVPQAGSAPPSSGGTGGTGGTGSTGGTSTGNNPPVPPSQRP